MLFWILQQSFISLIVIWLVHSIFSFLKTNLTTPKIRDLVDKPRKEYDEIYKIINGNRILSNNSSTNLYNHTETNKEPSASMKNELRDYLKQLNTTKIPVQQNQSQLQNQQPELQSRQRQLHNQHSNYTEYSNMPVSESKNNGNMPHTMFPNGNTPFASNFTSEYTTL